MKSPEQLTSRQQAIYDLIKDMIINRGYRPTVREIGEQFGIRSPNGVMCHLKALEKKGYILRSPNKSRAIELTSQALGTGRGLPLVGVVAAGAMELAAEQDERIEFNDMFHGEGQFVLEVRGDSMIEDQICHGDLVVIEGKKEARNGDTVVALIDGTEATLKRFYRDGADVKLVPANHTMAPMEFHASRVEIRGVVRGLIRQY